MIMKDVELLMVKIGDDSAKFWWKEHVVCVFHCSFAQFVEHIPYKRKRFARYKCFFSKELFNLTIKSNKVSCLGYFMFRLCRAVKFL